MKSPQAETESFVPLFTLLRRKMRERGFTERGLEEALGWDLNHYQQLKRGLKSLQFVELIAMLKTIGVEPKAFFAELYDLPTKVVPAASELEELSILADSLTDLLVSRQLVNASELVRAVASRAGKPLLPEDGSS